MADSGSEPDTSYESCGNVESKMIEAGVEETNKAKATTDDVAAGEDKYKQPMSNTALAKDKVTGMMTGVKVIGSKWWSSSCDDSSENEKTPAAATAGKSSTSSATAVHSAIPSKKGPDIVDNQADLFFWNKQGKSFMGYGVGIAPLVLQTEANDGAKFRIIRVDTLSMQGAAASANNTDPDSRKNPRVAITRTAKNGDIEYISCGTKTRLQNFALAWFSSERGEKETFTMSYCKEGDTFLFQSHNNLFLCYSKIFHSVQFKTCSDRDEHHVPIKGRWELRMGNEGN